MIQSRVIVDFCGEEYVVTPAGLTIGRTADVEIDDNPYLHRRFLEIRNEHDFWWLENVGSTLTATVADDLGVFQAWLNPGARIPLAMSRMLVWFTAGLTTYDFEIPSSQQAADRLSWTITRFNRKLDNVCQKFADAGIRGLHGGVGKLASNRKSRLVEHALSTKVVTADDLVLLDSLDPA